MKDKLAWQLESNHPQVAKNLVTQPRKIHSAKVSRADFESQPLLPGFEGEGERRRMLASILRHLLHRSQHGLEVTAADAAFLLPYVDRSERDDQPHDAISRSETR
jgi:hypothetical protein